MTPLNGQWVEVFRAGEYGDKGSYAPADIDAMVRNYDARTHEAPVVIGHPEQNAPAFGWIEALRRDGDVLMAKLKDVQPEFEDLVRRGLFKKRSISFYRGEQGPALRHLGFLGAMPPEVKGLKDLRLFDLRDGGRVVTEIELKEAKEVAMGDLDKKTLMESIKETLKEFFGEGKPAGQAGAKQFTEDDVTRIAAAAAEKATQPLTTKISELETKLSEAEKRDGQKSAADLAEGAVAKLKADGKWLPAFDAMGAPQIFAELAQSEKKITFGEADKKTEKSPLQVFADFLAGLPQIVPAGEIAKGASSAKKGGRVIPFTETKGVELDQDSIAFNEAAETRAKEKSIDLGAAMRELRSEGWKPAAGSAAAGAV